MRTLILATLALTTNQTFARLPEGDFTARILTANVFGTAYALRMAYVSDAARIRRALKNTERSR